MSRQQRVKASMARSKATREKPFPKIAPDRQGLFRAKAQKAGMSTYAYATKVKKDLVGKTDGDPKKLELLRQAVYALNFGFKKRK